MQKRRYWRLAAGAFEFGIRVTEVRQILRAKSLGFILFLGPLRNGHGFFHGSGALRNQRPNLADTPAFDAGFGICRQGIELSHRGMAYEVCGVDADLLRHEMLEPCEPVQVSKRPVDVVVGTIQRRQHQPPITREFEAQVTQTRPTVYAAAID